MNDVLKTIAERSACRDYKDQPVEREKIEAIVKAGLQAPSALNKQPWKILAITDKGLIDEINDHVFDRIKSREDQTAYLRIMERGGKPYYNAPVMILVLKRTDVVGEWDFIDCGIVVQNMALAAQSLGLGNVIAAMTGTAFTRSEQKEEFMAKVSWPENYEFAIGMLVGYGNKSKEPHEIDPDKVIFA